MPDTTSATPVLSAPASRSLVQGECYETATRLVLAPKAGVFEPSADLSTGSTISAGQVVGHLIGGVARTPVVSPFAGATGAALACSGERMVAHQPIMWLSLDTGARGALR